MILTPAAAAKVSELLARQNPPEQGLRISVVGGGCSGFAYSMRFDSPTPFDKTFTFAGATIFIDQASLLYLDGTTVDYTETLESSGFTFVNPNVKRTCGCGKSFGV